MGKIKIREKDIFCIEEIKRSGYEDPFNIYDMVEEKKGEPRFFKYGEEITEEEFNRKLDYYRVYSKDFRSCDFLKEDVEFVDKFN